MEAMAACTGAAVAHSRLAGHHPCAEREAALQYGCSGVSGRCTDAGSLGVVALHCG